MCNMFVDFTYVDDIEASCEWIDYILTSPDSDLGKAETPRIL